MKKISMPTKEIILKTLIVVGIISIIFSLYIQYGKPYIKELLLEKQDQIRIKDLDTLNLTIKDIVLASNTQFIGENNTIYISIPSDDSTCSNLNLPSVPDGWKYHCSNQTDYQNTNGTGWIPVNFEGKINKLFIDPTNKAETLNYYAYVANSPGYVLTGIFNSKKYLKSKAESDMGTDLIRYEVGNNKKLWGDAEGLVGYWPIDEGLGDVIHEISGKNIDGELSNVANWVSISNKNWLKFNGYNNYIDIKKGTVYPTTRIEFLIRIGEKSGTIISSLSYVPEKKGHDGYSITITPEKEIAAFMYAKSGSPAVSLISSSIDTNKTYSVKILFSNTDNRMYIDNILISRNNSRLDFGLTPMIQDTNIGRYNYMPDKSNYFDGFIRDLKIFSNSL